MILALMGPDYWASYVTVKRLTFILREMGRHWRVLSKGSDLSFKRNTLPNAEDSGRGRENGKEAMATNQAKNDGGGDLSSCS